MRKEMNLLTCTVCLFLLTTTVRAQNDVELIFDPVQPNGEYKEGTNLKFTCKVKPQVLDLVKIVKRDSEGVTYEISTNDFLGRLFKDTGRYTIQVEEVGDFRETSITITNLQGADSGTIECQHALLDGTVNTAAEDVTVLVPVKSVELIQYTDGQVGDLEGGKLKFQEGMDTGLICRVTVEGTQRTPTVSISLGDQDITSMFSVEEEPVTSGPAGLRVYQNSFMYEHFSSEPNLESHGKTMTCTASMPEFEPVSQAAEVEVHYGPRLDCQPVVIAKGEKAEILVTGQFNPDLELFSVSWDRNPNKYILDLDNLESEGYSISHEADGHEHTFKLTVDEVDDDSFGTFLFEVQNAVSSASIEAKLIEVVPLTDPPATTTTTAEHPEPETTPEEDISDDSDDEIQDKGGASSITAQTTAITCLAVTVFSALYNWS